MRSAREDFSRALKLPFVVAAGRCLFSFLLVSTGGCVLSYAESSVHGLLYWEFQRPTSSPSLLYLNTVKSGGIHHWTINGGYGIDLGWL